MTDPRLARIQAAARMPLPRLAADALTTALKLIGDLQAEAAALRAVAVPAPLPPPPPPPMDKSAATAALRRELTAAKQSAAGQAGQNAQLRKQLDDVNRTLQARDVCIATLQKSLTAANAKIADLRRGKGTPQALSTNRTRSWRIRHCPPCQRCGGLTMRLEAKHCRPCHLEIVKEAAKARVREALERKRDAALRD